jgi:serine/threonine protein kinase
MTGYHKDALPTGYQLAEYMIESVLGHGGFGITYLAKDVQLGTQVAIKEYLPHNFALRKGATTIVPNPEGDTVVTYQCGLKEFLREGQALARFKHSNIVRVLRFIEANGTAYMVMEYEKGTSLSQHLKGNGARLDQADLLRIFLPIMNGLQAVHEAGLLHLDIKPENIYLHEDGTPMLIDFGSARQALLGPGQSQVVALTPGYAPIEQYPDNGKQGPWTDVYALGASLYRGIGGNRPVSSTDRHEAVRKYQSDPLPAATQIGSEHYPTYVLESIDWALRIHAKERPQTARELQDALMGKGCLKRHATAPRAATFRAGKPAPHNSVPPRTAGTLARGDGGGWCHWCGRRAPGIRAESAFPGPDGLLGSGHSVCYGVIVEPTDQAAKQERQETPAVGRRDRRRRGEIDARGRSGHWRHLEPGAQVNGGFVANRAGAHAHRPRRLGACGRVCTGWHQTGLRRL